MHVTVLASCIAALLFSAVVAQTPVAELAMPPADARHFVIQSTAGKHGDSWSWVAADGTRMGRESLNLRGQVWEIDFSGHTGPDGMPSSVTIRGVTPQGDAAEQFSIKGGTATWKSPVDGASASYGPPAFYSTFGGPIEGMAWFVEREHHRWKGQDARPGIVGQPHARVGRHHGAAGTLAWHHLHS
jgi:hypothetical protein